MLYLGIGDMPIYNFDKVLKTNNLNYLVVGWNERENIQTPDKAKDRWNDIYNDYCLKTENNEALTFYNLMCKQSYLEMRYVSIHSLIDVLCDAYKTEIGERLIKWDVPFNIEDSIENQLESLQRHLRIAEQDIKVTKSKLDALRNDDDEPTSIIQQKIKLERVVGVKLDLKQTSVEEWIELHKEAKSIIEQQNKAING